MWSLLVVFNEQRQHGCLSAGGTASSSRPPGFGSFKASSFPSGGAAAFGGASRDFESATLMKMRQKAERDRLLAEEEAKDEAELQQ